MAVVVYIFLCYIALTAGSPLQDPVIKKLHDGPRFQHIEGPDGKLYLVDLWMKASDVAEAARFDPDRDNVYHLFTRQNPTLSQPMMLGTNNLLAQSNFNPQRRTVVIIHGWRNSVTGNINTVLVPAFLGAADVNVNFLLPILCVSVARFINWVNQVTRASFDDYHIVGHSLGGHQAGIVGRNLDRKAGYITSLDPALPGWVTNSNKFQENDGTYTEVMHTNSGYQGYLSPLGHVDFYPNGGVNMPGCDSSGCSHARCYFYLAESLTSPFTGRGCANLTDAINGNCNLQETLQMGGLQPKTGSTGIFHLETNAGPPFSRG
ncbi:hypothetical protein K1T71_000587 [Dendrolimus kikuchii]|uniref:Uncharacterized protein n=1 Tax=Dendrolimus kikuchii TaxID=765133 RepID=A0ACC1DKB2_9NEOP|nr:hypothetical protein K1T71_000587 [Dendrolimus kikuchii]